MCLITYLLFISSKVIGNKINPSMMKVISRIMGLILAVIAVQMMLNGIGSAITLFNHPV
jgi:multiple antibiotic resistance protein